MGAMLSRRIKMEELKMNRKIERIEGEDNWKITQDEELKLSWQEIMQNYQMLEQQLEKTKMFATKENVEKKKAQFEAQVKQQAAEFEQLLKPESLEKVAEQLKKVEARLEEMKPHYEEAKAIQAKLIEEMKKAEEKKEE